MLKELIELIQNQLHNQFLAGGITMLIVAGVWSVIRDIPGTLWSLLKRQAVTTVDLADHDMSFYWLQKWFNDHPYTKRARLLTASTRQKPGQSAEDFNKLEIIFSPAPGKHLLLYKGHLILLTRIRTASDKLLGGDMAYRETITLQSLSRTAIHNLIEEAQTKARPPNDLKISLLHPNWDNWKVVQRRNPRSLDSVVTDNGLAADLLADIEWFTKSSQWYADRGIPYQRGYLLEGPPGNGKSSLVVALASTLRRDIHILELGRMSDSAVSAAMSALPEKAIVLIEDIDGVFDQRVSSAEHLTFSGFINAIDGVTSTSGRILFVTTNHVEKLDPALIRPGRMDRRIHVKNASPDQAYRMFLRFFPGEENKARAFEEAVRNAPREYSMASLQEHLIKHRDQAQEAITLPVFIRVETPLDRTSASRKAKVVKA